MTSTTGVAELAGKMSGNIYASSENMAGNRELRSREAYYNKLVQEQNNAKDLLQLCRLAIFGAPLLAVLNYIFQFAAW